MTQNPSTSTPSTYSTDPASSNKDKMTRSPALSAAMYTPAQVTRASSAPPSFPSPQKGGGSFSAFRSAEDMSSTTRAITNEDVFTAKNKDDSVFAGSDFLPTGMRDGVLGYDETVRQSQQGNSFSRYDETVRQSRNVNSSQGGMNFSFSQDEDSNHEYSTASRDGITGFEQSEREGTADTEVPELPTYVSNFEIYDEENWNSEDREESLEPETRVLQPIDVHVFESIETEGLELPTSVSDFEIYDEENWNPEDREESLEPETQVLQPIGVDFVEIETENLELPASVSGSEIYDEEDKENWNPGDWEDHVENEGRVVQSIEEEDVESIETCEEDEDKENQDPGEWMSMEERATQFQAERESIAPTELPEESIIDESTGYDEENKENQGEWIRGLRAWDAGDGTEYITRAESEMSEDVEMSEGSSVGESSTEDEDEDEDNQAPAALDSDDESERMKRARRESTGSDTWVHSLRVEDPFMVDEDKKDGRDPWYEAFKTSSELDGIRASREEAPEVEIWEDEDEEFEESDEMDLNEDDEDKENI